MASTKNDRVVVGDGQQHQGKIVWVRHVLTFSIGRRVVVARAQPYSKTNGSTGPP
jgi:hypothetical protein